MPNNKQINFYGRTVDLDRSRCVADNGKHGDARMELWIEGDGESVWIETNGEPIDGFDDIASTLVDHFGVNREEAELAAEGNLQAILSIFG